ncbi:MAG: RNase adapter RapZ [Syntrophomonadaceae bacterium]|jgi:UPF0042 nucleotide-binding protein
MAQETAALHVLIITGMSGAGKSQVINCLEDLEYYCVDNLPPSLLTKFIELSLQSEGKIDKVALVIDVRGGDFFHDLSTALDDLEQMDIPYEIIYMEASDQVLVRRFKESRRRHPLTTTGRLLDSIQVERRMLEELRGKANVIIDTSDLTPKELKEKLTSMYQEKQSGFSVNVVSFGYKLGVPLDSDIVMDVRFLPNPFYDPVMRTMTGEEKPVIDYVMESPVTGSFTRRYLSLLRFLIPNYIKEGKTNLSLAIGCTGGQHRSVVLADYLGKQLKKMGYRVLIKHRDISRYKVEE